MKDKAGPVQQRFAVSDCLSGTALALLLRNNGILTDEAYAILRQAFQEIALLANNNELVINAKGSLDAIDSYLLAKHPSISKAFNETRGQEGRLALDLCLTMREQLLEIITLLTKIAFALKGIRSDPPLDTYDLTLINTLQQETQKLKDLYSLLIRIPADSIVPPELRSSSNDLAKLLALRPQTRKSKPAQYHIGKFRSFLLHQLVGTMTIVRSVVGDLRSIAPQPPEALKQIEADCAQTIEALTDALEHSLKNEIDKSEQEILLPLMPSLLSTQAVLENLLKALQPVAREPWPAQPAHTKADLALKADKSWLRYRQHQLDSIKANLISL